MQTDPTWFCLIPLLVLAIIGVSMREVDWTEENRKHNKKKGK